MSPTVSPIELETPTSIAAGKKKKGELLFVITDTGASTYEELEDAEFTLAIYDEYSFEDICTVNNLMI